MFFPDDASVRLLNVREYIFENDIKTTKERPFYALSLRTEGDTDIVISGKTHHLSNRSIALFPPNTRYKRITKRDRLIVFHFTAENTSDIPFTVTEDFSYEKIYPLFNEALEEYNTGNTNSIFSATALFYRVLAELCEKNDKKPSKQKALIEEYFRLHCCESDFSVSKAAHELYLCENGLRKAVKKHFGTSPKHLCDNMRMEYAKGLLLSGYYSVLSVSEMSGFSSPKNFATAYKKHFGISPSKV